MFSAAALSLLQNFAVVDMAATGTRAGGATAARATTRQSCTKRASKGQRGWWREREEEEEG